MKVKLLNDGGYGDMELVKFPVEVEGSLVPDCNGELVRISGSELIRVGASSSSDDWDPDFFYNFFVGSEAELTE